jgi:hypothetical protein
MKIESINSILKYEKNINSRIVALDRMRDSIKMIASHGECPTCEREFSDSEKTEMQRIKLALDAEINRALNERDEIERVNAPINEKARANREKCDEKYRSHRMSYIESHKAIFSKLAREYRKDPASFLLPENIIPVSEKLIWNDSIYWWSMQGTSREDIEAFQFQI